MKFKLDVSQYIFFCISKAVALCKELVVVFVNAKVLAICCNITVFFLYLHAFKRSWLLELAECFQGILHFFQAMYHNYSNTSTTIMFQVFYLYRVNTEKQLSLTDGHIILGKGTKHQKTLLGKHWDTKNSYFVAPKIHLFHAVNTNKIVIN